MKICIHSNQFDGRGTGKTPYDYGVAIRNILGHDVCYMVSSQSKNEGPHRIKKEFPVYMYDGKVDINPSNEVRGQIEKLVEDNQIDFIQMLKFGTNDNITPSNCKSGIHYVFDGSSPHGSSYAAVSENLARKFKKTDYVPHIIHKVSPQRNLRKDLNIPDDAFIVGRHGGEETFDLGFVHQAISFSLEKRSNLYFVFLSTKKFIEHERVIYLDWIADEQGIYDFIHSCDVMLHGRSNGETFGLSVGEFSACNKPVMTWTGAGYHFYDTAHIDHLGKNALLYRDANDVVSYLLGLERSHILNKNWDMFTDTFSDRNVINLYEKVFLK